MKSLFLVLVSGWIFQDLPAQEINHSKSNSVSTKKEMTAFTVAIQDLHIVRLSGSRVHISWHTMGGAPLGFEVERRLGPDQPFSRIGFVRSAAGGSGEEILDYTFTDHHAPTGSSFYRIRQMDGKGTVYYSMAREVR